jgi:hypothetical protein
MVSQADANGHTIKYCYNLLGILTSRIEPDSTTALQWIHGTSATSHNIGRIAQVTEPDGYGESHTYDRLGRSQQVTYTEGGINYTFTYAYNNSETLDTLTYPTSTTGYQFVAKHVYDAYGYLNQVKDNAAGTVFWTLNSANDSNLPTLETMASINSSRN